MKKLSLYIHIPFCQSKCAYCDFLSYEIGSNNNIEVHNNYVKALIEEIKLTAQAYTEYEITTIFFGGGTPSFISENLIEETINNLNQVFNINKNAEITIECNPESANKNKLEIYKKIGINRISFGVQSFDNRLLKKISRVHTYEKFFENYNNARKIGFTNINFDLMYCLPDQTLEDYQKTILSAIDLNPEHISCYSLILEEGTPLFENKNLILVNELEETQMYEFSKNNLSKADYNHYEISNYSKPNYECKHNLVYWSNGEYLGLGLGSSSYIDGKTRFTKTTELKNYLSQDFENKNIINLTQNDKYEEYIFLGLRKINGISLSEFKETFGTDISNIYSQQIKKNIENNLLMQEDDYLKLTEKGVYLSNQVFVDFMK